MTSTCLFDMIVDDKSDLQNMIPSKKRMKIENTHGDLQESKIFNINLKKEEDLKRIFPFLSVEVTIHLIEVDRRHTQKDFL